MLDAMKSGHDLAETFVTTETNHFEADLASNVAVVAESIESVATENVAPQAAPVATGPKPISDAFVKLGLSPELLRAVADLGFTEPTPVQLRTIPKAIPQVVGGGVADANAYVDLMVSSQTGSGKTAAFLLPVLHQVQALERAAAEAEVAAYKAAADKALEDGTPPPKRAKRKNPMDSRNFEPCRPLALVLTPTRELAQQVTHDAVDLVRQMKGCRVATVMGGTPYGLQIQRLQNASVVVATPGRLLDLQRSGQMQLDGVQFFVVDEADRMLDLGFADDLAEIHRLTEARRQTMMFSATFAPRIMALGERVMRKPQRIEVDSAQQKHTNITQLLYWADDEQHQRALLDHFLRDKSVEQAIVFSGTQEECDNLANDLADEGFSAAALHGAMPQGMRNKRLNMLREGRIQFLIATDVAARGIDVPSITHVINYGLPMKAEDYTHRIGRTGRAGRQGHAITIAPQRARRRVADIEAFTRQQLESAMVPGLEPKIRAPLGKKPFGKSFGGGGKPGFGGPRGSMTGGSYGERNERFTPRQFSDRPPMPGQGRRFGENDTFAPRAPTQAAPSDWADRAVRPPMHAREERAPRQDFRPDTRQDTRQEPRFAPRAPRQDGGGFGGGTGEFNRAPRPQNDGQFRGFGAKPAGGFGGGREGGREGGRDDRGGFGGFGRPAHPGGPKRPSFGASKPGFKR